MTEAAVVNAEGQGQGLESAASGLRDTEDEPFAAHSTVNGKRSRWGPKGERAEFAGMSTELPPGLTESQLKSYVVYIRLEEINRKLKSGQVYPYGEEEGDADRASFHRRKLEDERARLIESALQNNPEYSTDVDYNTWLDKHLFGPGARDKPRTAAQKQMTDANASSGSGRTGRSTTSGSAAPPPASGSSTYKYQEKVWIPQREYPDINFIGLLIGPRGNTLKKMESETGTKISIRGKGSLKEGKNDPASLAAADQELHALVMADSQERIEKCVRIINKIIETAASTPDESNELKRLQLRELAALNGTLREEETIICSNCGQPGHRRFECTERRNVTNALVCRICGGAGHLASDCMHRDNPEMLQQSRIRAEQMDSAYQDFLADIGEKKSQSGRAGTAQDGAGPMGTSMASPWATTSNNPTNPWA